MKLYLSSYRIPTPETLEGMLPKPINACSVGVIENAKDKRDNVEEAEQKKKQLSQDLHSVGFGDVYFIDVMNVGENFSFENYDLIYGAGGNTFALNYALRVSGHDSTLVRYIGNGGVYLGESAGAIILGKSIEKFDNVDDIAVVPKIFPDGLGLVDGVLCPHADSPEFASEIEQTRQYYEHKGVTTIVLNDNQVFVVDGEKQFIDNGVYFGNENWPRS